MSEFEKACRDMMLTGTGFLQDGKRVDPAEMIADRPDFEAQYCGSLYMLRPTTPEARKHLEERVDDEAQWLGGALAVERRYMEPLKARLEENGFTVGMS